MSSWASISAAELGRRGELLAAWWLRLHGYRVLHRNLRVAGVEVDIVAARGRQLVVCEVKTRRTTTFGSALEAVGPAKEARLQRAGEVLFERYPRLSSVRYDVIAIDGLRLRHIRAAFP